MEWASFNLLVLLEELRVSAQKFFTHPAGVLASAIAATFLWGSAIPVVKKSYEHFGIASGEFGKQMLFAGYRFFLAGLLLWLVFYLWKGIALPKREEFLPVIKVGLFQTFLQYVFFYIGLSLSTGVQGSIIAGTTTFFQIIFAHFIYLDDRLSVRKILGMVIGFTGVVLANMNSGKLDFHFSTGEWLLIIAMIASALGNILAKQASVKVAVGVLTSWQMMMGGAGLALIGISLEGAFPFHFDWIAGLLLLYLSFVSATGFFIWNNVMKYNPVGKVSMYLFLVPVFGVLLSTILLNETLQAMVLVSLCLVATGIIIVNREKQA